MNKPDQQQVQLLARALYEIRLILSGYIGSTVEADTSVRVAAHLAYALHNEAEAVANGGSFNLEVARSKIRAVDKMFGENLLSRLQSSEH
jgi:hypothetical protein